MAIWHFICIKITPQSVILPPVIMAIFDYFSAEIITNFSELVAQTLNEHFGKLSCEGINVCAFFLFYFLIEIVQTESRD